MESLGNELKAERNKRNIPLEKIADETRISGRYLQLLEEGRYGELPGGMYNRAFLRSYCEYLGLDAVSFLQRYDAETASAGDKTLKSRSNVFQPMSFPQPHPFVIWTLLLCLTIAGMYLSRKWISSVFSPYFSHPPAANIETTNEPTPVPAPVSPAAQTAAPSPAAPGGAQQAGTPGTPQTTGAVTEPTAAQPTNFEPGPPLPFTVSALTPPVSPTLPPSGDSAAQPVLTKAIQIQMHAVDQCWVSVTSDGKRVFANTLLPGDNQSFDAAERFFIVLGNAGAVQMTINGRPARPLGKIGEVIKLSIDKQSMLDLIEKTTG